MATISELFTAVFSVLVMPVAVRTTFEYISHNFNVSSPDVLSTNQNTMLCVVVAYV